MTTLACAMRWIAYCARPAFKRSPISRGEAFLEDAEHGRANCILLDIQLGGMSGFELQNRLTASGSTTPVIFITAHDDAEIREQARQTKCVAYLRKTDPGDAVLEAIRRAVHLDKDKV